MKDLIKHVLISAVFCLFAGSLQASVDATTTCTDAVNALLSGNKSRMASSPYGAYSGTREIRWSSTEGHQGICAVDDHGRVFEIRVTKFPQTSTKPYSLTCESVKKRRKECPMKGPATVQVERLTSKVRCTRDQNWGVRDTTLWVDKGCKGRFRVTPLPTWTAYTLTCKSEKNRLVECPIKPDAVVRFHRQLGKYNCRQGSTWGQNDEAVWVNKGCWGVFLVQPWSSQNPGLHPTRELARQTCSEKAKEHRFTVRGSRVVETSLDHFDVELDTIRNKISVELMCRFDVNTETVRLYSF